MYLYTNSFKLKSKKKKQKKTDDGRSISRNVAEKYYDSRHDKLRKNMDTTESTNTNIFKTKIVMYCRMAPTQCFSSGKGLVLVLPEVDRICNEMKVKATYRLREQVTE